MSEELQAPIARKSTLKCEKVAIVDDDPMICTSLSKLIVGHLGMRHPAIAHAGEEIVDSVLNDGLSPDVIVMDYRLPNMNGIEASKIIAASRPEIRIILATSDASAKELAVSEGFGFLQKPFSLRGFVDALTSK
jgi:CheY-like chemotaxis protein